MASDGPFIDDPGPAGHSHRGDLHSTGGASTDDVVADDLGLVAHGLKGRGGGGVGLTVVDDIESPNSHSHAHEEDDLSPLSAASGEGHKKSKRKRGDATAQLRKAPQAPKRFKSSYICFFMAKQPEIKEELGDKATVTLISKRSAEMWKNLSQEDRAHWDDVAAKDKQRYMVEKSTYTGPWQVPWKRAKKDPSAPKRPMSAFLYFAQGRRTRLKNENPDMKNTEISRILGEMWRNATEEERRPHVEKEKSEREKYKVAVAEWREEYEKKMEADKNRAAAAAVQQQHPMDPYNMMPPSGDGGVVGGMMVGGAMAREQEQQQLAMPSHQTPMYSPDQYNNPAPAPAYMYGMYPYQYAPYQLPTNGKPVILGPNGAPLAYSPQQMQAPQYGQQQQQAPGTQSQQQQQQPQQQSPHEQQQQQQQPAAQQQQYQQYPPMTAYDDMPHLHHPIRHHQSQQYPYDYVPDAGDGGDQE